MKKIRLLLGILLFVGFICTSCGEIQGEVANLIVSESVDDKNAFALQRKEPTDIANKNASVFESTESSEQHDIYGIENSVEILDESEKDTGTKYVYDVLYEQIPELEGYENHIIEKSNGMASFIIKIVPWPHVSFDDKFDCEYYLVYIGEQWSDHSANWYWFYVKKDFSEVLWFDIVSAEVKTLDEWRNSISYQNLSEN